MEGVSRRVYYQTIAEAQLDNEVSSIVMAQSPQSTGKVLAVRGGVVDVAFEGVGPVKEQEKAPQTAA